MIKRIFKFWLWNNNIFHLSQSGRDFKKSLKILHTFTENVCKKYFYHSNLLKKLNILYLYNKNILSNGYILKILIFNFRL